MGRGQLYKERYDLEWNHRSHLLGMTNFCVVVATIAGTTLVAAAQSFNYGAEVYVLRMFVSLLALSIASFALAIYYIGRALIGGVYTYLPTPIQLEDYFSAIEEDAGTGVSSDEFEKFVDRRIIEAASANFETNRVRTHYVQQALKGISGSLVLLAVAAVPYLLSKLT